MTVCNVCKKYLKVNEDRWWCDDCETEHHPDCSGESSSGTGEYPDEDAYSICKKCVDEMDKHGDFMVSEYEKQN